MKSAVVTLIGVSRWRFWLYLAGTYLVGSAAGAGSVSDLNCPRFWTHLVFFLFPANLMLYGVNDLFDTDTDALNPKKGSVEHKLSESNRSTVLVGTAGAAVLALALIPLQNTAAAALTMAAFVALSVGYSAPPFRLKRVPILDSLSNILYALPGFLGYAQVSGRSAGPSAFAAAGLWTAAMHLYSAVPDIDSDRAAGISTTATLLGRRAALAVCTTLWLAFALWVSAAGILWPWSLALLIYPAVSAAVFVRPPETAVRVYWFFPAINSALGMLGFFLLVSGK